MVPFGSTKRPRLKTKEDPNLKSLIEAETEAITIVGKSWDLHVKDALRVSLKENLDLIGDSISYLKSKVQEVFYDAEHFFDGYKANPEYALKTLKVAEDAGADLLHVGCNGWQLCSQYNYRPMVVAALRKSVRMPIEAHLMICNPITDCP